MIRTGIIGATGYTGLELARLITRHPAAELAWLTSEQSAGARYGDVFPVPPPLSQLPLVASADAHLAGVDLVFCCLPHAASQAQVAAARAAGVKVVDPDSNSLSSNCSNAGQAAMSPSIRSFIDVPDMSGLLSPNEVRCLGRERQPNIPCPWDFSIT